MNPRVSVIIPCYNGADTISRAISSVLAQTYHNYEIIIVNDGSTDDTEKVVKKIQEKDKRIKLLRHTSNKGLMVTRNTGIKNANGDYIAFLDADDEWLKNKLKKQIELFHKKNDEKLGIVYCGAIFERHNKISYWMPPKEGFILNELLKRNIILGGGSSCLIKKKVFDDCGLFDESNKMRNKQDYEMWLRIAQKYKFSFIKDYLVKTYLSKGISYDVHILNPIKGALASLYILKKHKELYKMNPSGLSNLLKYIGIQYLWAQYPGKARKYFKLSIFNYKKNYTSYIFLYISFLGSFLARIVSLRINRFFERFFL